MNKYFKGVAHQEGYGCFKPNQLGGFGLGKIASKFFSFISPYLSKVKEIALPTIKSGAKEVGQELVKSAADIARDVIRGRNVKESASDRFSADRLKEIAINKGDELINKVESKLQQGDGYKRKHKVTFCLPLNKKKKKKQNKDIFS